MEAGTLTAENAAIGLEKLEYKGMLYDFYGELLTQHQKKVYEDAVFNDLSVSNADFRYNARFLGADFVHQLH